MIKFIILSFLAIIAHIISQYIAFLYYDLEPNFRIKKYRIFVGENIYKNIRLDKYLKILIVSPIFALPLILLFNPWVLFIYLLVCGMDLLRIIAIVYYFIKGEDIRLYSLNSLILRIERLELYDYFTSKRKKENNIVSQLIKNF